MCLCVRACVCWVSSASPSALCPSARAIGDHAFQSESFPLTASAKAKNKKRMLILLAGHNWWVHPVAFTAHPGPCLQSLIDTFYLWARCEHTHMDAQKQELKKNPKTSLPSSRLVFMLAGFTLHSDIMLCAGGRPPQTPLLRRANLAMCSRCSL